MHYEIFRAQISHFPLIAHVKWHLYQLQPNKYVHRVFFFVKSLTGCDNHCPYSEAILQFYIDSWAKKTVVSFVHFTFKSCFLSTFKLFIPGVSWCYWVKMPYKILSKSINVSDARLMQEWSHEDRTNHTMCACVSQIYSQLCPLNWSLI